MTEPVPAPQPEPFKLNNKEQLLLDSLNKMNPKLGKMYLGALMVFADTKNLDRLALAAHDLRELMEKIPEHMDVKMKVESLRAKTQQICAEWRKQSKKIKAGDDEGVRIFLKKFEEFSVWVDGSTPARKEEISKALKSFEPKGRGLPPSLEEMRVDEWDQIWDYFKHAAHHRTQDDVDQFLQWKEALEKFLLDRLCPRTFEDHAELRDLIERGEADANP